MKTGYLKIWRDLWRSLGRTILAVLSITVGVFAVGLVSGMNDFLPASMSRSFRESQPAHITLFVQRAIGDDEVASLARLPGVAGVEGVLITGARWRPDANTPWRDARIVVRSDYTAQKYNQLELISGHWPDKRGAAAERTTLSGFGISEGESITLLIDKRESVVMIDATLRDLQIFPPAFGGDATFFISRDLAESLFGTRNYNRLYAQIPHFSEAEAETATDLIKNRLEKMSAPAYAAEIQDPSRHFNQDLVDSVTLILGVLAILSLALGLFLVVNTISAIVAQQVSQIGVMKAIGATTGQLLRLYLSGLVFYGILSLLIAVPLGGLATYVLVGPLLDLLNVPIDAFRFSTTAIAQQIGVGLLAPLLAGLWPVSSGVRITVREAISSYGIGTGYGNNVFDRILSRIRGLPRPMALTLRNTFRRKARLALTQITLITAGIVFLMVFSVNESFSSTIDYVFKSLGLDVFISFSQTVRIDEAEAILAAQPGVERVEARWFRATTGLRNKDDVDGESVFINAVPPDTAFFSPAMTAGRWLLPADGRAVVLNQNIASKLSLKPGDPITFSFDDIGKQEWTIVGTVFDLSNDQTNAYVPRDVFLREIGQVGRATYAFIGTTRHDKATQTQVANAVRAAFESRGVRVASVVTGAEQTEQGQNQFNILVLLLLVMSGLIALVGSIGLAGTLSINVLERRREIGVMRAIGASSSTVAGLFVGEGLMLGLIATLLAMPLSVPIGGLFASAISSVIDFGVIYEFSWLGASIWLVIIVALSIAASAVPALRATRMSVRESLAYE
jgi:putative ABC transport system permease protein